MFCDVVVDVNSRQVNKTFEYKIPLEYEEIIEVGLRVKVPFGTRVVMGFVVGLHENSSFDESKLKNIIEPLDINPVITKEFLLLAKYMVDTYYTFYISALQTMIPSALKVKYFKKVHLLNHNLDESILSLFKKDYYTIKNNDPNLRVFKQLELKKDVEIINDFKGQGNAKTVKMISLVNDNLNYKSPKGQMVLDYLKEVVEDVPLDLFIHDMSISNSILKTLESHGNIKIYDTEVYREPYVYDVSDKKIVLNEEQNYVYNKINESLGYFNTFLIHGVTGSGKTEIYLNLIENVLKRGLEAIVLVPEISLTPQMNARFKARFKSQVALLHSRLSIGEKYDEWRRIVYGEAKVVVGARSAIFAPLKNIGIIIVDEEHENSYIQDTNPKYDAIDIASYRAKYHNCPLVLGSATPRIDSYYHAINGDYKLLELNKRANSKPLPIAKVIDMREEIKSGNKSIFSSLLLSKIKEKYKNKEQTILFLNKRGFSSFVMCRECGTVIKCPNCDVSLTYHKINERIKCHYCGYETLTPKICPTCNSKYIRFVGGGTEKVEEQLKKEIPGIRTIRVDIDTTKNKYAYENLFSSFKNQEADVMIGTQIVAKGLDFPHVSLVGVINADIGLKIPSYDSNEIVYGLLEQVSGRAGRANTTGEVIIQSYDPNHYSIDYAKKHDYKGFYKEEIRQRKILFNPPYSIRIEIMVSSDKKDLSYRSANEIISYLKDKAKKSKIYGPAEAFIFKLNNQYRYTITIKFEEDEMKDSLLYINSLFQNKNNVTISITRT